MGFEIGDMVVYGIHGVCQVVDIESRVVDRKTVEYYVLSPVGQQDAKFYVPTHNPAAVAKMRKVLTKEEINRLLESEAVKEDNWIPNEAVRKETYRQIISRADCVELIRMIRALYIHKQEQLAAGKKFHQCDEAFMRDAERLIRSELQEVLHIPQEQIGEYIRSKVETNQ